MKRLMNVRKTQDIHLLFNIYVAPFKVFSIKGNAHMPTFNPILETTVVFTFQNFDQLL